MKKILSKISLTRYLLVWSLVIFTALFNSCAEDFYELNKPSWLGESIYDQLEAGYQDESGANHTFVVYLRLIDDIGYAEVLKKTGSKTVFVSDDAAFTRFFASNAWGVKSYEGFSIAQKKLILNSSMINNAYLIELMSNIEGPIEGQAMRRKTAVAVIDSITLEKGDNIPLNSNWNFCRDKGILLVKDDTPAPMVHFLQKQMDYKGITDADFSFLYNGQTRQKNDAHIFGNKIIARDITCKNGYINILQDVLIPPSNMAEVVRTAPETKIFSKILERFSAPYRNLELENQYKLIHPNFTDSIFTKRYFAKRSGNKLGANLYDPRNNLQIGLLDFDPSWNSYTNTSTTFQTDMGVIFAPKDEALKAYFNTKDGGGYFLTEYYGSIDNIPNERLSFLLCNLMKPSFVGSVPRRFSEILDDGQEPMGVKEADVKKSYIANNGVVYVTDKVYSPAYYAAVTAPTLINEKMKVIAWAVDYHKFDAYLLSMDSRYSFIVPWDVTAGYTKGDGLYYIDPVSLSKDVPEIFKFWHNSKTNKVNATAYQYNSTTNSIGDSIRVASDDEVNNRLKDMLDYHIVVGDIEDGKEYYRTKGGGEIKISGTGLSMQILGSGNIEKGMSNKVTKIYDQTKETKGRGNGKTYATETPLSPSYRSVYKTLKEEPEFSEFYKLLLGNDQATQEELKKFAILEKAGLDFNIKFFNTYHYTVYVPTNAAIKAAIAQGLPTWELIQQQTSQSKKDSLTNGLVNFLRYHFQDNSVYVDGASSASSVYETAAYSLTGMKSYYKLYTKLTNSGLSVANSLSTLNDDALSAHVTSNSALRNIMCRDYKFNILDVKKATTIETSSYAVIHQIDKVLLFKNDQLSKLKQLVRKSATRNKTSYTKSLAK